MLRLSASDLEKTQVLIIGTGLQECVLSAALALQQIPVLQIDGNPFYGGHDATLSWKEYWDSFVQGPEGGFPLFSSPQLVSLQPSILETFKDLRFSLDLRPRIWECQSRVVDECRKAKVAEYLEFQGVKSSSLVGDQGLHQIPLNKTEVFLHNGLTRPEKRVLMRFLTSEACQSNFGFHPISKVGTDVHKGLKKCEPIDLGGFPFFVDFLRDRGLTPKLVAAVLYAICLIPTDQGFEKTVTTQEGLDLINRYMSSLGIYGSSPFLYPVYGNADLLQAFSRRSALHASIFMLRTSVAAMDPVHVELTNGDQLKVKQVVYGSGQLPGRVSPNRAFCRLTAVAHCPEAAAFDLLTLPPGTHRSTVQVLRLDSSAGVCPPGFQVYYLVARQADLPACLPEILDMDQLIFYLTYEEYAELPENPEGLSSHVTEGTAANGESPRHQYELRGSSSELILEASVFEGVDLVFEGITHKGTLFEVESDEILEASQT